MPHLCLGERLTGSEWTGLPLGVFEPPGHGEELPVAAFQDTLFLWQDGASPATVRSRDGSRHYERGRGVIDLMAVDEPVRIRHDRPEEPGRCLLVAVPPGLREAMGHRPPPNAEERMPSLFGLRDERLQGLAEALWRQQREGEPLGRLYTEAASSALVAHLMVHYARHQPSAETKAGKRLTPQQRDRLARYIDERLSGDLGLADIADHAGLSTPQLMRLFKASFGVSPYQYVVQRRIDRAKALLKEGRLSLAEIGIACGFSDQPHFTSVFSRTVGVPPGRYRAYVQ